MRMQDRNLRLEDEGGSFDGPPFRVGILPVPGFALVSYACTVEPLRAANLLSKKPLYEVVHFGQAARVESSGAASVERSAAIGEDVPLHLVLVVANHILLMLYLKNQIDDTIQHQL